MTVLKKQNRNRLLLLGKIPETNHPSVSSTEMSNETRKALSKLTIEERNLIYLRVYEELSYKKIAEIQESSDATLRKKFERARKKFIKAYRKEVEENENRRTEDTNIELCK